MKKITKLLVVSAIFTMLFAMPVMAREAGISSENTDQLITLLNNNTAQLQKELADFVSVQVGKEADGVISSQTALVNDELAKFNRECAENHINFLEAGLKNAAALEERCQAMVTYATNNEASMISSAQAELSKAGVDKAAAEAALAAAKAKLAAYMQ